MGARDGRLPRLPIAPTPLIGRRQEVEAACRQLFQEEVRLLTLTGPPGVGKTRLALEAGAALTENFRGEIVFVSLAPITDYAQVVPAIARVLGLQEESDVPLSDVLVTGLAQRRLLLILDNFEQVIAAASQVGDLLAGCSDLKILVTSRERLDLSWEHEFPVAPLGLPDLKGLPAPEALSDYPAVGLFIERARAARPDFRLTEQNARAVAEICTRLDGLPLAIELAAARIRHLPPLAMLVRLQSGLAALARGARDSVERHRTLRTAIEWSYGLLDARVQALFRRLAVFTGSCTPDAAEAVGRADGDAPLNVLEELASLVDKNLLVQVDGADGEARFRMLETIREFGLQMLAANNEVDEARRRHAGYFVAIAEESYVGRWRELQRWGRRLEADHDNLRAAYATFAEQGEWDAAVQLVGAMGWYLRGRCHYDEARRYFEEVLEQGRAAPPALRARVLALAGHLELNMGKLDTARAMCEESLALYRSLGAKAEQPYVLNILALVTRSQGDDAQARPLLEECVALSRECDNRYFLAASLGNLALLRTAKGRHPRYHSMMQEVLALQRELNDKGGLSETHQMLGYDALDAGDLAAARRHFEEALALSEEVGAERAIASLSVDLGYLLLQKGDYAAAAAHFERDRVISRRLGNLRGVARALRGLSEVAIIQGDYAAAHALLEEGLALPTQHVHRAPPVGLLTDLGRLARYQGDLMRSAALLQDALQQSRGLGARSHVADALRELATTVQVQGIYEKALTLYKESLNITLDLWDNRSVAECLERLATLPCAPEHAAHAARLLGAVETLRHGVTPARALPDRALYKRSVARLRAQMGDQAFEAARAEGRGMSLDQVVAEAMAFEAAPPPGLAEAPTALRSALLTPRELEVAQLIAQGLSNREIAATLVITEGTAENHVQHILEKLEFNSRAQIAAWVVAHNSSSLPAN